MSNFYLGGPVDADGERIDGATTAFDPSDLTTHGVIVGMTGSGKTGLGIIYLEEALRSGIPTLVIDPKGDMTNLLLTFPELAPDDFRPWIDEAAAAKDGRTADEEADRVADMWRGGLASWQLDGSDIGTLRSEVDMTIYTPGSRVGVPLNVVGSLDPPPLDWDTEAETMRDEIGGFVSGLLDLIGIEADPIASREHILIANLVERAWQAGEPIDVPTLIGEVAEPPIRKLGVFDVDTFFPAKDRMALAMKLNSLLASPSFAAWMEGVDLDVASLLWSDGKPQASIIYLAHLSDAERQFVVTMLLSKVITWMRSQPGSSELRALIYMDEVFGFAPPTAEPPAKKPILTILKQARAFGVGMLLSTQNPVDLDYKAMSNAGTWCIGRLQTERDKLRIIEALTTATGDADTAMLDAQISTLPKRTFLLHSTRAKAPAVFVTRWAMSYLRGPMTRSEISMIQPAKFEAAPTDTGAPATVAAEAPTAAPPPTVHESVEVHAVHPSAPWAGAVGFDAAGDRLEPGVALTVDLRFDESRAGIDHTETWEAILYPLTDPPDAANLIEVDHDPRDFTTIPEGLPYVTPDVPLDKKSYFDAIGSMVKRDLDAHETLELWRNAELKAVSRPGESREGFAERCAALARDGSDAEIAKVARRYSTRMKTAQREYEAAVRAADTAQQRLDDLQGDALIGMAFDLLTGKRPRTSRTSQRSAASRVRSAEDKIAAKRDKLETLAADLEDTATDIASEWADKATDIAPFAVGLERDDIAIKDVSVVWIRRRSPDQS